MLSDSDARILRYIKLHDGLVFSDECPSDFSPLRIDGLADRRLIHCAAHPSGIVAYQLLPAGEDALSEKDRFKHDLVQQEAQQQADEKARKWSALKNAAFNIFLALFGAAVGSLITFLLDHR